MAHVSAPGAGSQHIVACRGGPNWMGWLRVPDPLPLEVPYDGGLYVLVCGPPVGAAVAGPPGDVAAGPHARCSEHWYEFVDDGWT